MIAVTGRAEAAYLRINACTSSYSVAPFLENQHRRPFTHDEAITVAVEGSTRLSRVVVPCGHRAYERERAVTQRCDGALDATCKGDIRLPITNEPKAVPDPDRA